MYNVDGLSRLKLANSSSLSSLVASLWDRYQVKLANGNVYKVDVWQLEISQLEFTLVFGWRNLDTARENLCAGFCFHVE